MGRGKSQRSLTTGTSASLIDLVSFPAEITREHDAVCHAATSAIQHARRAGDLLLEAKAALAHGQWLIWLAANCPTVPERTAQAYMRVASEWPTLEAKAQRVADLPLRDALKLLTNGQPRVAYNTGDFEWYSPADYIDAARSVMGQIDLDPASTPAANAVVRASRFYSLDEDGLGHEWYGRVWMNPPYAQPLVTQFCEKLAASVRAGTVTAAIVLVNNCTETRFFTALLREASALCFPQGRVRFWKPDQITDGPLQGQAVIYVGADADRFGAEFSHVGIVAEIRRDLLVTDVVNEPEDVSEVSAAAGAEDASCSV